MGYKNYYMVVILINLARVAFEMRPKPIVVRTLVCTKFYWFLSKKEVVIVATSEETLMELYTAYKTDEYGVLNQKYGYLRSLCSAYV